MLVVRCWLFDVGCSMLDVGCSMLDSLLSNVLRGNEEFFWIFQCGVQVAQATRSAEVGAPSDQQRQGTAALQDASRLRTLRQCASFWTAPVLWRFCFGSA